jgi:uncharacterized repeat protein (TIGR03803 family)
MIDLRLGRYALGVCAAAMLAGCGGGRTPLSPSPAEVTAVPTHERPAYSVLYSFKGGTSDGKYPEADLLNVNGTLYGTTSEGGCGSSDHCGTVFKVTTSGKEAVLHNFGGSGDGSYPQAGLLNVNGTLYGTTAEGGANCKKTYGCGTVFSITTSGKETVLYSFNSKYGYHPDAGLINVNGTLYGTTYNGGAHSLGTVFSITTSGKETVLYSFGTGSEDGGYPAAGLINVNGTLYGTTTYGGAEHAGTVFSITTSGKETVLHSFPTGSEDGEDPQAGLINLHGTLYGTTADATATGGSECFSASAGCGTVFSITTSGKETVLHFFGGITSGQDGEDPQASLLNVNGTLYGTTAWGGGSGSCKTFSGLYGCGTVFAITRSGKETVLHSFTSKPDGAGPEAALLNVNGSLYGTTAVGGANKAGTVFSISP